MRFLFEDQEEREILGVRLGVEDYDDDTAMRAAIQDWLSESPPVDERDNDIRRAREAEALAREQARGARLVRLQRGREQEAVAMAARDAQRRGRVFYGGRELGR